MDARTENLPSVVRRRFRRLEPFRSGGTAALYRGVLKEGGVEVVLKVYGAASSPTEGPALEDADLRWKREVVLMRRIRHRCLARLVFATRVDSTFFVAYEYVEGVPFDFLRVPSPPSECVPLVEDLLDALAFLHAAGVVHRDVKPGNAVRRSSDGRAVLLDFGLIKEVAGAGTRTATGLIVATPAYCAPEQLTGEPVGPWSDLYSLALVFHFLLKGRPLFGGSLREIVSAKLGPEPPQTGSPPALESFFARALHRDPAARFRDVDSFRRTLRSALSPRRRPPRRSGGRHTPPGGPPSGRKRAEGGAGDEAPLSSSRSGPSSSLLLRGALVLLLLVFLYSFLLVKPDSPPLRPPPHAGGGSVAAAPRRGPSAGGVFLHCVGDEMSMMLDFVLPRGWRNAEQGGTPSLFCETNSETLQGEGWMRGVRRRVGLKVDEHGAVRACVALGRVESSSVVPRIRWRCTLKVGRRRWGAGGWLGFSCYHLLPSPVERFKPFHKYVLVDPRMNSDYVWSTGEIALGKRMLVLQDLGGTVYCFRAGDDGEMRPWWFWSWRDGGRRLRTKGCLDDGLVPVSYGLAVCGDALVFLDRVACAVVRLDAASTSRAFERICRECGAEPRLLLRRCLEYSAFGGGGGSDETLLQVKERCVMASRKWREKLRGGGAVEGVDVFPLPFDEMDGCWILPVDEAGRFVGAGRASDPGGCFVVVTARRRGDADWSTWMGRFSFEQGCFVSAERREGRRIRRNEPPPPLLDSLEPVVALRTGKGNRELYWLKSAAEPPVLLFSTCGGYGSSVGARSAGKWLFCGRARRDGGDFSGVLVFPDDGKVRRIDFGGGAASHSDVRFISLDSPLMTPWCDGGRFLTLDVSRCGVWYRIRRRKIRLCSFELAAPCRLEEKLLLSEMDMSRISFRSLLWRKWLYAAADGLFVVVDCSAGSIKEAEAVWSKGVVYPAKYCSYLYPLESIGGRGVCFPTMAGLSLVRLRDEVVWREIGHGK